MEPEGATHSVLTQGHCRVLPDESEEEDSEPPLKTWLMATQRTVVPYGAEVP